MQVAFSVDEASHVRSTIYARIRRRLTFVSMPSAKSAIQAAFMSSRTADNTLIEPETVLSEEEWLEAKRVALRLVRSGEIDKPEAHLTYVRDRISAALGKDVV